MSSVITLKLAAYLARSRANGPGLRTVLWVQGCPLRCKGCFNEKFWPAEGGQETLIEDLLIRIMGESTEGISLSGGEPFMQALPLAKIAECVQAAGRSVLTFSGFSVGELRLRADQGSKRLLAATDLLVAGPYEQQYPSHHPLLASTNQELVHLTSRYHDYNFGSKRVEYHIEHTGIVVMTGFPLG